jgi:hypothetical protein
MAAPVRNILDSGIPSSSVLSPLPLAFNYSHVPGKVLNFTQHSNVTKSFEQNLPKNLCFTKIPSAIL